MTLENAYKIKENQNHKTNTCIEITFLWIRTCRKRVEGNNKDAKTGFVGGALLVILIIVLLYDYNEKS